MSQQFVLDAGFLLMREQKVSVVLLSALRVLLLRDLLLVVLKSPVSTIADTVLHVVGVVTSDLPWRITKVLESQGHLLRRTGVWQSACGRSQPWASHRLDVSVLGSIVIPNGQQHRLHGAIHIVGPCDGLSHAHRWSVSNEGMLRVSCLDNERSTDRLLSPKLFNDVRPDPALQLITEKLDNCTVYSSSHESKRVRRTDHAVEGVQFLKVSLLY
jgi:hypothetical protein